MGGKGSETPVGGMLTIMHMAKKVMKMKNLGTRTQGQISMTLVTKPMEVDQGAKAMAVVKIKVATAARRAEVVVVAETQEEEWEEVVLQNEERTPIIYPIRKSHFHVTYAELITKLVLGLNIISGILTRTKMATLLPLKMLPEFLVKVKERLVVLGALAAHLRLMKVGIVEALL